MVIRDKQALRRCVKQAARRAPVTETLLRFRPESGPLGVDAALAGLPRHRGAGAPLHPDTAAFYAALEALDLPSYDLARARAEAEGYERDAYLRALLDAMRAERAYVVVPLSRAQETAFPDARLAPLLAVDDAAFEAGRYGVHYERDAQRIAAAMRACGARELLCEAGEDALRFALLPMGEDEGFRLHVGLRSLQEARNLAALLERFPGARALAWMRCNLASEQADGERLLVDASAALPQLTVRLSGTENLPYALGKLGSRFLAYAACSPQPEIALGRWLCFKERLHPLLAEAYLPLARAGYELRSEQIEADVRRMLGGCLSENGPADEEIDPAD